MRRVAKLRLVLDPANVNHSPVLTHDLLHLGDHVVVGLSTSEERRLEDLFPVGIFLVGIYWEVGVEGLLRSLGVTEGDLKVNLYLTVGEVRGVGN